MHPAPSIIVFTVLSGLGYGLAAMLGLGLLDPAALATKIAHVTALGAIGGGLISSTMHLGNPQRAWRAFSQWRSSWLSREGVMAVITFLPLLCSAWASIVDNRYIGATGFLGSALALTTVYCTAMIYASLRSIDAWHTPLTAVCYLLFAAASGSVAAAFFAMAGGGNAHFLSGLAMLLLLAAWTAKLFWRNRLNGLSSRSTPETATGLGPIGRVRLFERPHVNDNYLTREMGFKVARKHAVKLRSIALGLGGATPFLLLGLLLLSGVEAGVPASSIAFLALLANVVGMLVERWLFFAEARHAVMNYYGG